jgi:AcrR family transcriptional regulator
MGGQKKRHGYLRARTSSQKAERRETILRTAESQLRTSGFESFSMGALAKSIGIARGTLYLYFETREEVLLTLYTSQAIAWNEMLFESVYDGIDDEAFLQIFWAAFRKDPLFIQLSARLGDVIEQNVSIERLIETKRTVYSVILKLANQLSHALHLNQKNAADLLISLVVLIAGASQIDNEPAIDPELLPFDLAEMTKVMTSEAVFMRAARLIMSGIRLAV